jgi:hypothetical protein
MRINKLLRNYPLSPVIVIAGAIAILGDCAAPKSHPSSVSSETSDALQACPVTQPLWVKPPDDPAVQGEAGHGYYFVNEDGSLWASAWWEVSEGYQLVAGEEGNKIGWFRPAGEKLEIRGNQLDAPAPALQAEIPCCYPTRFQASGVTFPTEGCWEVTAQSGGGGLKFVVEVNP